MLNITKDINQADFITHAGNFHADDVFSTVLLEKLHGDITIIRVPNYNGELNKLAYDIGGGEFDHHQAGYDKKRENGIHYCSFGLLWREFGRKYLESIKVLDIEETFKVFDYLLVNVIDAFDNGEFDIKSDFNVYTVPSLIELFRPKYGEDKEEDECFKEAVKFAHIIFDLVMHDAISRVKGITKIKEYIPNIKNRTLILKEFVPYEFAIFNLGIDKEIDFVVYPSNRGGYAAKCVPTYYKGFTSKRPFKDEWAGLRDEELSRVSGIKSARFCHNKLFLFTADTKEDVLKAIELSQKQIKEQYHE